MFSSAMPVSLSSSMDAAPIRGTLSIPANPRGLILMIGGSGKTDRDETVPPSLTLTGKEQRLFLQLSDALTGSGFITLRYDKRGVLDAAGGVDRELWKSADRTHLLSDALDAAHYLRQRFPALKLLLLGHSEGTALAAAVAQSVTTAGILMLGTTATDFRSLLRFQIVDAPERIGTTVPREEREQEFLEAMELIATSAAPFAPDDKPLAWYREFLVAPSTAALVARLAVPVAVFQGDDDVQTPVEGAYELAKHRPVLLRIYPGLGHGFSQRRQGVPTLGPIEPQVLDDIRAVAESWIDNGSQ